MILIHGYGSFYWGVEHEPVDRKILTGSWLVEDLPPYRISIRAFRVRVGNRAIHMGLCKKGKKPLHKELPVISPSDIGQWGRKREETTEAGGDPPGVEVRQVQ